MNANARLAEQQQRLRWAILGDDAAAEGLLRPRGGGELIGIYRHAYRTRLAEALRDNHEKLPRVMGDLAFDALAAAYIESHPSRHASIRWYGDQLADFMVARPELAPHPALADLARMEWALRGAFDAADARPLQADALARLPADRWAALRLVPLPSARLLPLDWAVEPLWRALQEGDAAADADGRERVLPEPEPHAHALLVWRPALEPRWRSVTALEAALLRGVFLAEPFGLLCETAAGHCGEEHAAAAVVGALQGWLAEGLLAAAA